MNHRSRQGLALLAIAAVAWLGQHYLDSRVGDAGGVYADALLVIELACVLAGLVLLAWGIFGSDR